jgi:hypothetical protein
MAAAAGGSTVLWCPLPDTCGADCCALQALSHTSRLRSLRLDCCPRISDRGLLELSRAAGLRHLSIDRCPQISGEARVRLQRKRVLLRVAAQPTGAALERC